ncbi:MAG: hypothetical protein V4649_10195 [Bacteroidota bacterium]
MSRVHIGLIFIPLYLAWVIYHAFIKRDLKQHKNDFYGLTFFIAGICAVYYFVLYF